MTTTPEQFAIWINGKSNADSAHMSLDGKPTFTAALVQRFNTLAEATAEITRRGWENSTSVRPGRTTAYVVSVPALAIPPERFTVKHFPDNEYGKRWGIVNADGGAVAYAFCVELANHMVRVMNTDPDCLIFTSGV